MRNHCCSGKINNNYICSVCVCSLKYPACIVHAPYYIVVCGLFGSTIFFPYYFINGTIFWKKKLLHIQCVFWFLLQLLSENFLILRRIKKNIKSILLNKTREVWNYSASTFIICLLVRSFKQNDLFSLNFERMTCW